MWLRRDSEGTTAPSTPPHQPRPKEATEPTLRGKEKFLVQVINLDGGPETHMGKAASKAGVTSRDHYGHPPERRYTNPIHHWPRLFPGLTDSLTFHLPLMDQREWTPGKVSGKECRSKQVETGLCALSDSKGAMSRAGQHQFLKHPECSYHCPSQGAWGPQSKKLCTPRR